MNIRLNGQARAANELRKEGILGVNPAVFEASGFGTIWKLFKKRLASLEERAAKEGIVYTEAQLTALETAKRSRESHPDEIETNIRVI